MDLEYNRIIFEDGTIFQSAPAPYEIEASIFSQTFKLGGIPRDTIRLTMTASYADVAAKFVPGAVWSIEQKVVTPIMTTITNDNGESIQVESGQFDISTVLFDKTEYSVYGDIVDHRDGRVTVYMGKPTETELLRDAVDTLILEALEG